MAEVSGATLVDPSAESEQVDDVLDSAAGT